MLKEVMEYLLPEAGDIILDATLGGGGHSQSILKKITPGGKLIALDMDPDAIERGVELLEDFKDSVVYVNNNFRNVDKILGANNIKRIDGAVFDLGVSSFQIDLAEKGFSFLREGPLDMRFDPEQDLSAKDVVNTFSSEELVDIIREYGEERHAKLVARAICAARKAKKIETTGELTEIVQRAVGSKYRSQKIHAACRTFQGLRIYVNDELAALEEALNKTIELLSPTARICVIAFHSLEDRIVKNIFRMRAKNGDLNLIVKKPLRPGIEEVQANSRSRSAKFRVAERI